MTASAGAPSWTADQERAIATDGCTLLVSAAAGSGKTSVLVERIVRRIVRRDDPWGVDEILVVTFTDAAALEMRRRVGAALADALRERPDDAHLRRQAALLPRAAISTLHAFCKRLLRRYFFRLELDPNFAILGPHEALLLADDVMNALFDRRYVSGDAAFLDLVDRYGGDGGDNRLRELVESLHAQSRSLPDPQGWLDGLARSFAAADRLGVWRAPALRRAAERAREAGRLLERGLRRSRQPGGPAEWSALLETELRGVAAVAAALDGGDPRAIHETLGAVCFARLPSGRRDAAGDPAAREQVKASRSAARELMAGISGSPLGSAAAEERAVGDLRDLAGPTLALGDLVRDFAWELRAAKSRRLAVDFGDLEHLALALLRAGSSTGDPEPSDIARHLRGRFRAVLVDEYQDTNPIQEAIVGLLAGPDDLFLVGDVKQSVYRFRMADPGLFMRRYERYPTKGPGSHRIDLQANFRSRPCVVDAVNFVFRQIMAPDTGEIAYDGEAELRAHAPFPPGDRPVEVRILVDQAAPDADGDALPRLAREADAMARRILELRAAGQASDGRGGLRPLQWADFAILLRAANAHGPLFAERLSLAGVPVHAQAGTGYFGASEVVTMLALLEVVDNPRSDIPLAATLRSPICGLSGEDLARIRQAAPEVSYFDAVCAAARSPDGAGDLAARTRRFLERLESWRTAARRGSVSDLVWRLLTESDFLAFATGLPGGQARRANLLALHERAREFDTFAHAGLFRFLRFVRRLQDAGEDLAPAAPAAESADVVRIMSIHRSKGLEFPVVFVAGLGQRWNIQDSTADVVADRDLGLGPRVVDPERRIKYPSFAHLVVRDHIRRQALAEEMRVLYVALTRARERLILLGTAKEPARWAQAAEHSGWALPADLVAGARCPLDWIGLALARHRDGASLRQGDPADPGVAGDPSTWLVEVGPAQAPPAFAAGATAAEPDSPEEFQAEADAAIGRLTWRYPYQELTRAPSKLAASLAPPVREPGDADESPHPAAIRQTLAHRPRFVQAAAARLTAAERGIATHLLMQHVDFAADTTGAALDARLARLVEREILTPEGAGAIDRGAVLAFVASELGRRLAGAGSALRREVPFSVSAPIASIEPGMPPAVAHGEWTIVQGVIDAILCERTGLTILDWKTDDPAGRPLEDVAAAHRAQMSRYRDAAARIFGQPVQEAYLVFLAVNRVVPV